MPSSPVSIQRLHTFGLPVYAERVIEADSASLLQSALREAKREGKATLLLGSGSNMLFLEDFGGWIVLNRIKGIEVKESPDAWQIHVGAGENWHELVRHTLSLGMGGLRT